MGGYYFWQCVFSHYHELREQAMEKTIEDKRMLVAEEVPPTYEEVVVVKQQREEWGTEEIWSCPRNEESKDTRRKSDIRRKEEPEYEENEHEQVKNQMFISEKSRYIRSCEERKTKEISRFKMSRDARRA